MPQQIEMKSKVASKLFAKIWQRVATVEAIAAVTFAGVTLYELFMVSNKDPVVMTVTGIAAICFGGASAIHFERARGAVEK